MLAVWAVSGELSIEPIKSQKAQLNYFMHT
jgi:hypothetical protein